MATKQVNSRMRQKYDTLANWGKAPSFYPLEGEIIIISDAFGEGYPGIKVGDNKQTLLSDLEYIHGEREIVSVTRNQEDTGYTVLLSNGENFTLFDGAKGDPGYTPQKGVDYFDGAKGEPGTSVTITSINQNTSSGGVSTVTFSDGKTLFIYNGKDGASGGGGGEIDLTNIDLIGQGNSILHSANVASFGQANIVGQKAYSIVIPEDSKALNSNYNPPKECPIIPDDWRSSSYYILDSVEGLEAGDVFSIRLTEHRYNFGTITYIETSSNSVYVDTFFYQDFVENAPLFWVLQKPDVGTVDIGTAAFSAGVENSSQGYNSVALGGYNKAYGWYSTAIGRGNEVGYGAVGFGEDNKVNGTSAVGAGDSNIINAYAAVGFGVRNEITGPAGFVAGADNKVTARAAFVSGDQNINKGESALINGFKNVTNEVAKYSVTLGQENENKGQSSFICGKLCTTNAHLSAALGEGIITNARAQVAVGQFNAIRSGSIFLVGTGTSESDRKTSFEVLSNGETRVHNRMELRNSDNSDYHVAFYTGSNDTGDSSLGDIVGKFHVKGKIACSSLVVAGNTIDGTTWTPDSNGY